MTEDINEARTDDHPRSIYHLAGRLCRNASCWSDLHNMIAFQHKISIKPRVAGAIHDPGPADQNVDAACRHLRTSFFCHARRYGIVPTLFFAFFTHVCDTTVLTISLFLYIVPASGRVPVLPYHLLWYPDDRKP